MKYKIIVLAFGLALVAASCNKSSQTSTDTSNQTSSDQGTVTPVTTPSDAPTPAPTQTPNPTPAPTPAPAPTTITVQMTSSGFSPSTVTVKVGTTVVFKNTDTKPHWPASNPHPTHTDLPGFDALKNIEPGQSYSFTFTKVGNWGYHDHLNSSHGGHVIVQ